MLQVQLTGRDVPDASAAGPQLGRQFVVLAYGTGLAPMAEAQQAQEYFAGAGAGAETDEESNGGNGMPTNARCSSKGQTATFSFEIGDRSLETGTAIGYQLAQWAQATVGGTWEHRVCVVMDNESEAGSS